MDLNTALKIVLVLMILVEIIFIIHMIILNHLRYKNDREFWKKQEEIASKMLDKVKDLNFNIEEDSDGDDKYEIHRMDD